MLERRPFDELGGGNHGWLDTNYHFSFGAYHDPARMGFGNLRVWNDDTIAANSGFPPHPHQDMEIITYVREGSISHKDSLGNAGRTEAGDVQVMSAGTGIVHAEYNEGATQSLIFQIWLLPRRGGNKPTWGTKPFPKADRSGAFVVLASGDAGDVEALAIDADAKVLGATVCAKERLTYTFAPGHKGYLVAAVGKFSVNNVEVAAGDGVAITGEKQIEILAHQDCELVLVDTL